MYDEKKIKLVKTTVTVVISVLLLVLGVVIGSSLNRSTTDKNTSETKVESVEKKSKDLTTKEVKDFLIAYYTKKDLGENRNRYSPLVTVSMYNELVETENEPVNQAYKGYIVNQVFDSAEIYVDTENSSAIAIVSYKSTQRSEKGSDFNALENQFQQEAIDQNVMIKI